ncbi:hypothetical protein KIPB_010747, partial [Kipferlia bialata]|eukprot:g10747.t1
MPEDMPPAAPQPEQSAPEQGGRFNVCIRVKPLGAGGGGGEKERETAACTHTVAYDANTVSLVPRKAGVNAAPPPWAKGRPTTTTQGKRLAYKYAKKVIMPSEDQEDTYTDTQMDSLVQAFIQGYDVNFMANGQTGSGKTHCIFGPPTVDWTDPACAPDYGLLPRAALAMHHMLEEARESGGHTYVLVGSMLETKWSNWVMADLLCDKKDVYFNAEHEVVGAVE